MFRLSISRTFLNVPSSRASTWTWSSWIRAVFSTIPSFAPAIFSAKNRSHSLVAELDRVQRLELRAQVGDERGLARDPQVLVGLTLEELDERRFELGLALVRRLPGRRRERTRRRRCSGRRRRSARSEAPSAPRSCRFREREQPVAVVLVLLSSSFLFHPKGSDELARTGSKSVEHRGCPFLISEGNGRHLDA